MTPILGIMASQISGHLYTPTGSMFHIATTTLSSSAASITFSSIAADYTHLQVRATGRCTRSSSYIVDDIQMTFNSDTASNYSYHRVNSDPSSSTNTPTATGSASASSVGQALMIITDNAAASLVGTGVVDILDYANTNKYKTVRSLTGGDSNNAALNGVVGFVQLSSGNWRSNNSITSMTFTPSSGGNFVQYTSFSLYGVK